MHISEIIIDGFKSYSSRTVVGPFDPHFNAITGLNGSGKSNILDSICFVLGISNLSQVRVSNLQELVYKQGQAGITKASVTINFANPDPKCSPIGYEQFKVITVTRQIAIGGKNKFMINGRTSLQKDVENLFHSVQLNVNNPHFLIMQGRITKVLNMKPPEILSMIEEAAGTRMYETKKQNAQKTMEKKHQKVEELTQVMDGEIKPQLDKLRAERQNYSAWSSNSAEIEKLERFLIAFEYFNSQQKILHGDEEKATIETQITERTSKHKELLEEVETCTRKISELELLKSGETEIILNKLKKSESELNISLAKIVSSLKNQKESLVQEKEALSVLCKNRETVSNSLVDKERESQRLETDIAEKLRAVTALEKEAELLQERYQNACAGIADGVDAALLSLPEQIATWERAAREAQSKLQAGQLRSQHNRDRQETLKQEVEAGKRSHKQIAEQLEVSRAAVVEVEMRLNSLNYNPQQEIELKQHASILRENITKLQDRFDSLSAQIDGRLRFEFKDPVRDFDRTRIKGIVAKLFNVKDPRTAIALEIAAAGKLSSVVVDNDHTSKLILEKGGLKKRTTFYPLNKLNPHPMNQNKVRSAKEIAKSKNSQANLALELVDYEEEVRKAIEFVFGNVMICGSKEVASAITYNPSVGCRSVTLEGDTYNSDGTLSGGAQSNLGEVLVKLGELKSTREMLDQKQDELKVINANLQKVQQVSIQARELTKEVAQKKNDLAIWEQKSSQTSFSKAANELKSLEAEAVAWEQESIKLLETIETSKAHLIELKKVDNNSSNKREKAMKAIETEMKNAAKKVTSAKSEYNSMKKKRDTLIAELEAAKIELNSLTEQMSTLESSIEKLSKEVEAMVAEEGQQRARLGDAKRDLAEKQEEINASSKEIKALNLSKDKATKAAKATTAEIQNLQKQSLDVENGIRDAGKFIKDLVSKNVWIEKEKEYFNLTGSNYDFSTHDIPKNRTRLTTLKEDQDRLSKTINRKVIGMIAEAEAQYEDLQKKREVVLRDKQKIEAVIEELDVKKTEALQRTWTKVNADFGSIFSTLLPGCTAKLEPPDNGSVMDGLEVKVAFHGVWKDSLTELSGGQRSLLALSLILSLLLFKPAPMYILDEVDSALDLSHTENIGLMLRTHFSNSQFIVVSLKEGMFNNANVIFRTRFVDGLSTVMRTSAGPRGGRLNTAVEKYTDENARENEEPSKKKGKSLSKK